MSHNFRKIAAAATAIVCAASMCGCADNGYIGSVNGVQIPNGLYLYYVAVDGYNDAASKIKEDLGDSLGTAELTVFNNTVDGKTASAWLKDNAVEKLRRYAAIEALFTEYGMSLSEDDKTAIDERMSSLDNDLGYYAQYYGLASGESTFAEHYENMGISKSTLRLISENSYKEDDVFLHNYGADGLTPVTDDEINKYITENYAAVKYLKLTFTDYQGISLKEDADINKVKALAQEYVDRYNSTGDWSEIQYDFDLRQAQFDAWTKAEDDYAEKSTAEATAEPAAQEQPAPATVETATAEAPAATAEAAATVEAETPATAEASTGEATAEAPTEGVATNSDTIFEKPIVNTGNEAYDKFVQDAIDAATAEKKDADSVEQYIKKDSSSLDEGLTEYIWNAAADSKATLYLDETNNCIYVVVRDDATAQETWKTEQHETFLHALKDDAFEELLKNTYANYAVDLDDYLVNTKYAPEKLRGIGD